MRLPRLHIIQVLLVAIPLLAACGADGNQMREQLAQLEEQNRSDEQMLNDSLAEQLVDYFDRHGTANERMRARYMLGRTYFDLGELPRALETYYTARDCADTTAADCDYRTLSRIHAQSARVYAAQIQPRSQIAELKSAEYFALRAGDSISAIDCYSLQAQAYKQLLVSDSVIPIIENAAERYKSIHAPSRSSQVLSRAILPLLDVGEISKAKAYLDSYECYSGYFDSIGDIVKGKEIYYYIKGSYYLATNKLDSAENMFRKLIRLSSVLNNQIAGHKGLLDLFIMKSDADSTAKYAILCYELNDSSYRLSEMQNIQKMKYSYNYNFQKREADKKTMEAERAWYILSICVIILTIIATYFRKRFFSYKRAALDYRLKNSQIAIRFRQIANDESNPSLSDWRELQKYVEHEIDRFKLLKYNEGDELTDFEYDICLMVRIHLTPTEMCKLKNCSPAQISKIRRKLLLKVFGKEGTGEQFDDEIAKIV